MRLKRTETVSIYNDIYCVVSILEPRNSKSLEPMDLESYYVLESCTDEGLFFRVRTEDLDYQLDEFNSIESQQPFTIVEFWKS
jgi:hypothetical protein